MSRKKGAVVAIIAVVAAIGGLAAYTGIPRHEDSSPPPVLTTINRSDGPEEDGGTTVAEAPEGQQPANTSGIANNTVVANNTVIESNTIVINKPVYRNDTIIYQPVTINLENYKAVINRHAEQKDEPADRSHSLTIRADRIESDGWSGRFSDDGVGMFAAVYDIRGGLVDTGYADERGFTVKGLEDSLYFVFPADCTDCIGKGDIVFRQWDDGSKDRPRLVPADSEVTANYRLVVPEKPKQVPLTPPPGEAPTENPGNKPEPQDETGTAAEPEITLRAQNATFVYGWVQLSAQVENRVDGYDDLAISVYAPDGTLHDSFLYSDQQGFFASREAGEGDYRIVATYEYGGKTAQAEITHRIKFAEPEFVNLSAAEEEGGAVRLNGMLRGGLAGENITIMIQGPGGEELRQYGMSFGTRPVFSLFIAADEAGAIFNKTGDYTFAVTHVPTGAAGNATLFHNAGETETAAAPVNVSDNSGRSANVAVASQGSDVYLAWEDETSGRHEILFARSVDAGETFSEPVAISQLEEGGFARNPDIAADGETVYVVWGDYDSEEESTAAFAMSSDAGETFGNKTVLGNHTGEGADPELALLGGEVYVSWIAGAEEEFAGNLMVARSPDGANFEESQVAEKVDDVLMASSGEGLHLAWRHYPTGDTSEDYANVFARSGNGVDFETVEDIEGVAVTSLAASGGDLYLAGFVNETVLFAKSGNGTFNVTEISNGTMASVATAGDSVYIAWEQGGDISLAVNSAGGATFGEAENLSESETPSYMPAISTAENAYVAWTEGAGDNTDIMLAVR